MPSVVAGAGGGERGAGDSGRGPVGKAGSWRGVVVVSDIGGLVTGADGTVKVVCCETEAAAGVEAVVEVGAEGRERLLTRAVCWRANFSRNVLAAACSEAGVDGLASRVRALAAAEAVARWEALVLAIVREVGDGGSKEKSMSFGGLWLKTRPGVPGALADRWAEAVVGLDGCGRRGEGRFWGC